MFSLQGSNKFKVIIVGNMNVGKSSIFWRFTQNSFLQQKDQVTTIDFKMKTIKIQGHFLKLYIWDTAGQQRYRNIVSTYFKGCQGVILVFDLSNRQSFIDIKNVWLKLVKEKTQGAKMILVGNKSDLIHRVTIDQILTFAAYQKIDYVQASVKDNVGISQCFQKLGQKLLQIQCQDNKQRKASIALSGLKKQPNLKENNKRKCC